MPQILKNLASVREIILPFAIVIWNNSSCHRGEARHPGHWYPTFAPPHPKASLNGGVRIESILRRLLHVIDDENLDWAFG